MMRRVLDKPRTKLIAIRVTPDEFERVCKQAEALGVSLSELIREAINLPNNPTQHSN